MPSISILVLSGLIALLVSVALIVVRVGGVRTLARALRFSRDLAPE